MKSTPSALAACVTGSLVARAISRKDGLRGRGTGPPGQVMGALVNETAGRPVEAPRKAGDSASRRCGMRRIQVDDGQPIRFVARSGPADEDAASRQQGFVRRLDAGPAEGASSGARRPGTQPRSGFRQTTARGGGLSRAVTNTVRGASGAVSIRRRPRGARGGGGRFTQGAGKSKGVACGIP